MTGGPLFVQTEGLRQFSQIHAEIAAGVSQLIGGAPTVTGVETSHGQIAFAVQNALGGLLNARQGTLQTTAKSGDKIAELLRKAAAAYESGDERSAGKLKAAMEPAAGGPVGPASAAGGAGAAGGASGAIGQILGPLGQMGQQSSAAMQGIEQPAQQVVEAATGAARAGAEATGTEEAGAEAGTDSERAPVPENRDSEPATAAPTQQA